MSEFVTNHPWWMVAILLTVIICADLIADGLKGPDKS
jgi:hypothetical protein